LFARLLSARPAGAVVAQRLYETGGGVASTGVSIHPQLSTARLGTQRYSVSRTLANVGANVAIARLACIFSAVAGAFEFRLRIGAPQLEQGAFASSPILPAVGTPAASTRGAIFAALPGQAAPAGLDQVVVQIDAGTDANRLLLRNPAGGNDLRLTRQVASGAMVDATSLGNQVPGTSFAGWMSWDGAGGARAQLRGGAVQSVAGVPTGLTSGRIGNRADGLRALGGAVIALDEIPFQLSDTDAAAALAAFPF
jgi:hypothetical protein